MAYYDNYAGKKPTNTGRRIKTRLNRKFYQVLMGFLPQRPLEILEVGPGHGFFAEICSEQGHRYQGVEANEKMYRWLQERGFQVQNASPPPLSYEDNSFDLIYCGYVMENMPDPQTAFQFVVECGRVLKPNGILGIVSSDFRKMGAREYWNLGYMTSFLTTERRIRQILVDGDLEFQKSLFFSGIVFGPLRHPKSWFWKIYNYDLLARIFRTPGTPDTKFFKLRVSFPEGFFTIGKKIV